MRKKGLFWVFVLFFVFSGINVNISSIGSQQSKPIENTYCVQQLNLTLSSSTVHAAAGVEGAASTDKLGNSDQIKQYKGLIENKDLQPNLAKGANLFSIVMVVIGFVLGIIGVVVVMYLMTRLVVDVLIVTTGSHFGPLYGLSSFGRFEKSGKHYRAVERSNGKSEPNSMGEYVKVYLADIVISVVAGVFLLTGSIFDLSNKLTGIAIAGIQTIFSIDFTSPT